MARARNIKPGFFESEQVGSVSLGARLLFIALWQLADREGRLIERPMQIRAYAFRYDPITAEQAAAWLDELEASKLIERFPFMGQTAIEIPAFTKHQRPHSKEPQSVIARNISGEPEKNRATPPFHEQKPEIFQARPHSMTGEPEKVRASASWNGGEPALNPKYGILNADGAESRPPRSAPLALPAPPQQHEFPDFGADPDPGGMIDELVEEVAQHWPRPGNVPLAKRVWEREAAGSTKGVAAWCNSVRTTATLHSLAHLQALKSNPRHFIPDLVRWITDGDYSRPAPRVVEHEPQHRKPRFDPSSLEEPA